MSQHRSLKVDSVGAKHRNVLTRVERIKRMQEEKRWTENRSVFCLPKIKSMKIKVKKAAAKEKVAGAAADPKAVGKAAAPAAKSTAKPAAKK